MKWSFRDFRSRLRPRVCSQLGNTESRDEQQVSDVFHHFLRIGNATSPESVPYFVYLALDLARNQIRAPNLQSLTTNHNDGVSLSKLMRLSSIDSSVSR